MAFTIALIVAGAALMLGAARSHRRSEERDLDTLLRLAPVPSEGEEEAGEPEVSVLTGRAIALAGQVVDRMDPKRALSDMLERAQIRLRPGEFVIVLAGAALGVGALLLVLTHSTPLAVAGGAGVGIVAAPFLRLRVSKRRRAFEAQLPDALSLIASSLAAGHTFLRAIQMMCQESGPPLSEEFARVVAETRLGGSVVDALERMSARLQIRDLDMVVQAIRIQQSVGGKLSDLLHTLADVIRARDEVRREVKTLTAEGRMSAYVLAGLVPGLFLMLRLLNPKYITPLYSGKGLILLIACALSVVAGLVVILRMVRIDI